jgi:starch synthase
MKEEGHRVEVVVPKYDVINYEAIQDFKEITGFAWGSTYNRVFHGIVEGVDTYFIDPENGMFQVGMIYGTDYLEIPMTDAERFGFFSKAALEWMLQSNRQPDIIHCHDWQTAPVARSYWEDYHKFGLSNPRIVFTIHNLNYGAPLIKEAMTYSQVSTTVSRTYREEVSGHESIYENLDKFHGVVNGIDPDIWDPANDDFLPRYFDEHECNDGKAAARAALCAHSNIPNKTEAPMIGIVTRLTTQKGIHLIKHGIMRSLERGCQVVMLGSAPDPEVQQSFDQMFHELKQGYHDFMCFHLYYNEPLSHLIYAGADMILVPSMFEPCGLSQLIAMRYGTVPIVRRTGGLNDTVFDYDIDHGKAEWEGMKPNGFSFDGVDESSIDYALDRGIDLFYNRPGDFRELQRNCMTQDWSWNRPALEYIEVYHAARKPF